MGKKLEWYIKVNMKEIKIKIWVEIMIVYLEKE